MVNVVFMYEDGSDDSKIEKIQLDYRTLANILKCDWLHYNDVIYHIINKTYSLDFEEYIIWLMDEKYSNLYKNWGEVGATR